MKRNHTAFKRSNSPVGVPPQPTRGRIAIPQTGGGCLGKPDKELGDVPARAAVEAPASNGTTNNGPASDSDVPTRDAPKMPYFLQLTEDEMHEKYADLAALENDRLLAKSTNDSPTNQWARLDADPVLDRYSNIHPWANNRIHLKVPEGCNDYINASPITLVSTAAKQSSLKRGTQDKYICMQGPKKETVDHTWHMLWHELAEPYESTPAVIIMLSPTHAPHPNGVGFFEKCYPYFPMDENSGPLVINETGVLGDEFYAEVRFVSKEAPIPGSSVEVRQFAMSVHGEDGEKPIWHFLYPSWPDFGALEEKNVASIISLMQLSREKNGKADNPRIVHCSAGVGRTGTFIALEFLIGELQGGAWEDWTGTGDPIYETINQLRMQRRTMVQAFEQFAFLYKVLRKMWEEKYNVPYVGGNHEHSKESIVDQSYDEAGVAIDKGRGSSDEEDSTKSDEEVNVCETCPDYQHKPGEKCGSVDVCGLPGDSETL